MPYKVVKDGEQYCVQKEDGTAVKGGCHASKADADAMMKAIYANEKAAQTKERLFDQTEVNYTPVSMQMGKACAGCRWFEAADNWSDENRTPSCHLVYSWPQSIQPTGYCDRYEVFPSPQPMTVTPMPVVIVDPDTVESSMAELKHVDRNIVDRIVKSFRETVERLIPAADPQIGGFKVYKDVSGQDRWVAWYSNNFEDREKEFFSEKGFDRYVQRLDMGLVPMPKLRSWHVPGSEYGVADWVDRIGHFHVATGTYDDNELGRAGKAYDESHASDLGVSHGLLHRRKDKELIDGRNVFKDWNTFEISPLPYKRAANDLTAFAVENDMALKEAEMTEEKRKHLVEKFGEAAVARMETATEQRGKEIEEYRAFKDFIHPDGDEESQATAHKEALEAADKAFGELMPQLMEDAGEAVTAALQSVKAVKALQTDYETKIKSMQDAIDALRTEMSLRPRASASKQTVIKEDDPLAKKSQAGLTAEQEALKDGPLAGMFQNG